FDWSFALLPPDQQRLFAALGVFAGGCSVEAAQAVCPTASGDVEDALWDLVDHALLEPADCETIPGPPASAGQSADGGARFRMLETVREYALARLAESGEAAATQERHLAYFLGLAERALPQLRGPHDATWLTRLEAEHDNLRAALS